MSIATLPAAGAQQRSSTGRSSLLPYMKQNSARTGVGAPGRRAAVPPLVSCVKCKEGKSGSLRPWELSFLRRHGTIRQVRRRRGCIIATSQQHHQPRQTLLVLLLLYLECLWLLVLFVAFLWAMAVRPCCCRSPRCVLCLLRFYPSTSAHPVSVLAILV